MPEKVMLCHRCRNNVQIAIPLWDTELKHYWSQVQICFTCIRDLVFRTVTADAVGDEKYFWSQKGMENLMKEKSN